EVMVFFEDYLARKNISIQIENNISGETTIIADEKSLKATVLANVISNAIKFSHKDSIITLQLIDTSEFIFLKVHDSGIGMPASLIKKIFMAEEITCRSGTEGERGTGYGLPLVKTFIQSY